MLTVFDRLLRGRGRRGPTFVGRCRLGLAAALAMPAAALAQGGVIYLTGHDTLLHSGQHGYDQVVLDLLRCKGTPEEIPAASYDIAVIGSAGTGFWSWSGPFISAYPTPVFINADALTTAAAWGGALETVAGSGIPKYDAIVVLSHVSCGGCGLTTLGSNNLNLARPLIQNLFNNQGMDIWANAGAELTTYYNFLPPGFVTSAPPISGSTFCATPAGVAIGLTTPMTTGHQTHNKFASYSPSLTVSETNCPAIGNDVISLFGKGIQLEAGCTPPPGNMVLWMPFEENAGPSTANILMNPTGNGTAGGFVDFGLFGMVDYAVCFDDGWFDVTHYPALTLDNDFTIDAWVNVNGIAGVVRQNTIVDKRQYSTAFPGGWRGYRFYVETNGPTTGTLKLQFKNDLTTTVYLATGPTLLLNTWEHVAVAVDRHRPALNDMIVTFAVNGVCSAGAVSPGGPVAGTLGTPVTRIAGSLDTSAGDEWFAGCMDELEIFSRALGCAELANIHDSGDNGKCKEFCQVDWDRSFYGAQSSINVPAQICNNTHNPQMYNLSFGPAPCPFGFTPSPVGITSNPVNPITVPPYSCVTVWLNIPRPPFGFVGDVSCYEICMTNLTTGKVHCCHGSVQLARRTIVVLPGPDPRPLLTGTPRPIGMAVRNEGDTRTVAEFRVVVYGPDMLPDDGIVSLDGLPPGQPLEGSVDLPAGAESSIDFTALFTVDDPGRWYSIVLEMDIDGDGSLEPIESVSVTSGMQDPCPTLIKEGFEFYMPETEPCGIGGWEPWAGSTDVCGLVTIEQAASGMRSLRLEGQVGGATGLGDDMVQRLDLSSGRHELTLQTLVPAGATGRGWVVLLSEYPAPFNWALNLVLDADAGIIRDEQNAGLSAPLAIGVWTEVKVVIDLDADTVDAFYGGDQFIAGKSWTLGVPPSGPLTFQALDLYADEPGGRGSSGMYVDDIMLRTLCEPATPPCVADCDGSGVLDLFDFLCYQNLFATGDPRADLDGDGSLTLFDFLAFQNAFARGCP